VGFTNLHAHIYSIKMDIIKSTKESHTIMNELVLPNDTNTLNNLMGGKLLHWMDICAAIAAQKHSGKTVVTASVDSVSLIKIFI